MAYIVFEWGSDKFSPVHMYSTVFSMADWNLSYSSKKVSPANLSAVQSCNCFNNSARDLGKKMEFTALTTVEQI